MCRKGPFSFHCDDGNHCDDGETLRGKLWHNHIRCHCNAENAKSRQGLNTVHQWNKQPRQGRASKPRPCYLKNASGSKPRPCYLESGSAWIGVTGDERKADFTNSLFRCLHFWLWIIYKFVADGMQNVYPHTLCTHQLLTVNLTANFWWTHSSVNMGLTTMMFLKP